MTDHRGPWPRIKELIQAGDPSIVSGRFSERENRVWISGGIGDVTKHWLWGDAMDGTWFVTSWIDETGDSAGNSVFFPTAFEAEVYARAMAGRSSDIGAMMRLLEKRNDLARAAALAEA